MKSKYLFFVSIFFFIFACKNNQTTQDNPKVQKEEVFEVVVQKGNNYTISVKKDGIEISGNALKNVAKNSDLSIELVAKKGYLPNKLIINGTEYKNVQNNKIVANYKVLKKVIIQGEVTEIKKEKFTLTVASDSNAMATPASIEVEKDDLWSNVKKKLNIEFTDGWELEGWHFDDENGLLIEDSYQFISDKKVFAKTKR
ncbi:MAG: hypothetical protein ACTTKH_08310 [Treponema sp.]